MYPTVAPVSVSPLAVVVICPHCGAEEHQRMQRPAELGPIKPGEKVLFKSNCTKTLDAAYLIWGCKPNQGGYYIQFPSKPRK